MSTHAETLQMAARVHDGGDWLQAARLYTEIIQSEPRHPEALHRFGLLCQQIGKHADAREMLSRAIACAVPGSAADYRVTLAISYLAEGHAAEALAECELARAESTRAPLFLVQGQAFRQLGAVDEAIRCLQEGLDTYPGEVALRLELAQLWYEQGRWDEAANAFEEILETDSKHPIAILRLTEMMLAEAIEIGDHWINRLRLTLTYAGDEEMRNELRRKLVACHRARDEHEHADAVARQIR